MTPEEYIKEYTRRCSNELVAVESIDGKEVVSYHEWLTPENALEAVRLTREEARQEIMQCAVDGEVTLGKSLAIPSLGWVLDKNGLDFGDKVKVIIIK